MDFMIEILKTVAGGVIAAIITLAANGHRLDKDIERAARTLAIQLTDIFELYSLECAGIRERHGNNQRHNPYDYSGIAPLPTSPDLPSDDIGWRALDTALAIDSRTFGTRRKQSNDRILGTAEYGDAEDIEGAVEEQAAILGDVAWQLAARFRIRYKLGPSHVDLDVAEHFKQEISRIEKLRADSSTESAEMWASLEGRTGS